MKRRKFILGTGAAAAGGATLLGSGAFSSVEADRDIAIDVVNDDDAYLRLAACTDEDGNEKPNGAYVYQGDDGLFSISLSEDNGNDPPAGSGVNPEALSKFYNVFEICNQGTQDICLNFGVDSESDVPKIPDDADVPLRFDFGPGDPAVVFYEDDTEEPIFPVDGFGASDGITLEVGECRCFGFNVRAYGVDSGEDIFADTDLTIVADADAECEEEIPEPEPEPFYGVTRKDELFELELDDDELVETKLTDLGNTSPRDENQPNGLVYDGDNEIWYFSDTEDGEGIVFKLEDVDENPEEIETFEESTIGGATFVGERYVTILQETNDVILYDVNEEEIDFEIPLDTGEPDSISEIELGDLAVDPVARPPMLYGSILRSDETPEDEGKLFKVPLVDTDEPEVEIIVQGDGSEDGSRKQIAFFNGRLIGTDTSSGEFFEIDREDGSIELLDETDNEYTDLGQIVQSSFRF